MKNRMKMLPNILVSYFSSLLFVHPQDKGDIIEMKKVQKNSRKRAVSTLSQVGRVKLYYLELLKLYRIYQEEFSGFYSTIECFC